MALRTLSDLVFHVRDTSGGRSDLLSIERGGRTETLSTSDFLTAIHSLALALEQRGVQKGDRIALFSENRPEWHVVDFACHLLGAASVPLYPTLSLEQVGFILRNSGSTWVFYSDADKRDLLLGLRSSLRRLPTLVALDDEARAPEGLSFVPLLGEGAPAMASAPLERFRDRVAPEELASIIYTSGTTGEPKGVMLSHHNFVSNFLACEDLFPLGPRDLALSFLPLSHVFERTVDHMFFYKGVAIHYSPTIERVPPLLGRVRPTVFVSVPRLFERAYLKVRSNVAKESRLRRRLFAWALRVGERWFEARWGRLNPLLRLQHALARRLVHRKIHERFGGRLRFAIAGGAALADEVALFFDSVGVDLFQGYGMTEAAPVISANAYGRNRRGSVGKAVNEVELRLADDGEILVRSPGVMMGYWENPPATAQAIDADGWLHTGDIGRLDKDGFLYITDRKKDVLITSGGKNVAPQPIEQRLTSHWAIGQALVVGDDYPYLTALLVPRFEELPAPLQGVAPEEAVKSPELKRILKNAVDEVNAHLAEHERIRKWTVLDRELTQEAGEVTPTMKIRRKVVIERFAERIDAMYLKTQKVGRGRPGDS